MLPAHPPYSLRRLGTKKDTLSEWMLSASMCSLNRPSNTAMVSKAMDPHTNTLSNIATSRSGKIFVELIAINLHATYGDAHLNGQRRLRSKWTITQLRRHPD